jgi:hypothetical protein
MRVPVSWLRDYVSFDMPPRDLGERLSMTGTKLEALHRRGVPRDLDRYRVGRVVSPERRPAQPVRGRHRRRRAAADRVRGEQFRGRSDGGRRPAGRGAA